MLYVLQVPQTKKRCNVFLVIALSCLLCHVCLWFDLFFEVSHAGKLWNLFQYLSEAALPSGMFIASFMEIFFYIFIYFRF